MTDQPPLTGMDLDGSGGPDGVSGAGGGFRGPQVCRIVGITYRQLDYWARTDLVRPSLADARGSGSQRLYGYRDLVELKVVKSLLDSGISLQGARKAITYLRRELGDDLASANLVIDGGRSVIAHTGDQLVDLVREGQGVLNIVPLGRVKLELDASILALPTSSESSGEAASTAAPDKRRGEMRSSTG